MTRRSDRRVQGGTVDLSGEDHAWWSQARVNHTFASERPPTARERADDQAEPEAMLSTWVSTSPDAARAYQTLGIDGGASWDEVVATYRELARFWHPDRLAESPPAIQEEGQRRMSAFNAAYEDLRRLLAPSKRTLFTG